MSPAQKILDRVIFELKYRRLCKKFKFKAHKSRRARRTYVRRSESGMQCNAEVELLTKSPKE